jgi:ankyrin repeat protein
LNGRSSESNLTALQLAIKRHLPLVVENLCKRGADMSVLDSEGNSPLWNALDSGQEDIASILVTYLNKININYNNLIDIK